MNIKLSNYEISSLLRRQHLTKASLIGIKVCPLNGTTSVGTVINVGKKTKTPYYDAISYELKILWGSGSKRGKVELKSSGLVADFGRYLTAIKTEYDMLEAKAIEASTVGQ